MSHVERPLGVTAAVVVGVIIGIVDVVTGIVLMAARNDPAMLHATQLTPAAVLGYGLGALITGIIILAAMAPLARGVNFARFVVAIIALIALVDGVFELIRLPSAYSAAAVAHVLLGGLAIYLLFFRPKDNEFFLGDPPPGA